MSATRKVQANRYFSKKRPILPFFVLPFLVPDVGSALQWDDVLVELKKLVLDPDGCDLLKLRTVTYPWFPRFRS